MNFERVTQHQNQNTPLIFNFAQTKDNAAQMAQSNDYDSKGHNKANPLIPFIKLNANIKQNRKIVQNKQQQSIINAIHNNTQDLKVQNFPIITNRSNSNPPNNAKDEKSISIIKPDIQFQGEKQNEQIIQLRHAFQSQQQVQKNRNLKHLTNEEIRNINIISARQFAQNQNTNIAQNQNYQLNEANAYKFYPHMQNEQQQSLNAELAGGKFINKKRIQSTYLIQNGKINCEVARDDKQQDNNQSHNLTERKSSQPNNLNNTNITKVEDGTKNIINNIYQLSNPSSSLTDRGQRSNQNAQQPSSRYVQNNYNNQQQNQKAQRNQSQEYNIQKQQQIQTLQRANQHKQLVQQSMQMQVIENNENSHNIGNSNSMSLNKLHLADNNNGNIMQKDAIVFSSPQQKQQVQSRIRLYKKVQQINSNGNNDGTAQQYKFQRFENEIQQDERIFQKFKSVNGVIQAQQQITNAFQKQDQQQVERYQSNGFQNRIPLNNWQSKKKLAQNAKKQQNQASQQQSNEMYIKFAKYKTKPGMTVEKVTKINQDAVIISQNLGFDFQDHQFFCVCDGHGINGHKVSNQIKMSLPQNIDQQIKLSSDMAKVLSKSYYETNFEILQQIHLDTYLSGSTCVGVMIGKNSIWCANTGDSRAVMYYSKGNQTFLNYHTPLSTDHKPTNEEERERIIASGGRIQQSTTILGQKVGPPRVWNMNQDVPGLAMTRSFGDKAGITAGVISDPEVKQFDFPSSEFIIIIGSDGIWEFLTNQQVGQIIQPFFKDEINEAGVQMACDRLVQDATKAWMQRAQVIDDISVIIVYITKKN